MIVKMNKYIIYILSLVLFAACKGKQTSAPSDSLLFDTTPAQSKTDTIKVAAVEDTIFKPYKLIDNFMLLIPATLILDWEMAHMPL